MHAIKLELGFFLGYCSSRQVANHSARKTCMTSFLNQNVNPSLYVSQSVNLSGHKKLEILQSYIECRNIHEQPKTNDIDIRHRNRKSRYISKNSSWIIGILFYHQLFMVLYNINVYNNKKSSPSKHALNGYFNTSHSPPTCKMLYYVCTCK